MARLESTAEQVSATSAKMTARGEAYFAEWDQQLASIQNEDIRERSADRRRAVEASFSKLQENYGEAKGAFKPLLADLRDIRTALRADLTTDGLKALQPEVKQVDKGSRAARKELQELVERFRELGLRLSPPPPPPAPVAEAS